LVFSAVLLAGCAAPSEPPAPETAAAPPVESSASPSFGIEPQVSINAVMVGLVVHAAHHIWDLGREGAAPESENDWVEVEHHAIQLAAGASWIATGGAGEPDAGWVRQLPWSEYATQVNNGATAALEAARARNLESVLAAGDRIIEACEGCHREFKPDLPTEGIVHPHIYEARVK
jgi:hypothetical protein